MEHSGTVAQMTPSSFPDCGRTSGISPKNLPTGTVTSATYTLMASRPFASPSLRTRAAQGGPSLFRLSQSRSERQHMTQGAWIPMPALPPVSCRVTSAETGSTEVIKWTALEGADGGAGPEARNQEHRGGGSAASPAGCGADELGHLLHVICGQQHHLLVLREVFLEDLVQQPLPLQLWGGETEDSNGVKERQGRHRGH